MTEEDVRFHSIVDGCELLCSCWELNPGPLEEHPVLLTAERPLQPLEGFLFVRNFPSVPSLLTGLVCLFCYKMLISSSASTFSVSMETAAWIIPCLLVFLFCLLEMRLSAQLRAPQVVWALFCRLTSSQQ